MCKHQHDLISIQYIPILQVSQGFIYTTYWYQTLKALSKGQRSHFYILWDTPITNQIAYNLYIVQSSLIIVFTFCMHVKKCFCFVICFCHLRFHENHLF